MTQTITPAFRMRVFVFLLSSLPSLLAASCSKVQACAAKLSSYPQVEEDSSGWGSGMVPLYDDYFNPELFDYSETPEVESFDLCECPGNATCDTEDSSKTLQLDKTVELTFCEEVHKQITRPCRGDRGIIRIIGPAESSGRTITAVNSTLVFCNCPFGYQRQAPVTWGGEHLSIQYKCVTELMNIA